MSLLSALRIPSRRSRSGERPPSTAGAVGRFMLGTLAAVVVVVVGGFFALRSITLEEAERDTADRVRLDARLAQVGGLSDGLLSGDPQAVARLDAVVRAQVLRSSVVRVKVWARDGRILYSDEPRLMGLRFELGAEEAELFGTGGAEAELSDLTDPENRYERRYGGLLEAHTVARLPGGTPVLFEIYERFSSVNANSHRLLRALAPPLLGGLVVLVLFQAPLAWGMARSVRRGHDARERLLAAAVDSSSRERRRIAADLHDGVVQDLAGVAFGLAPLAEQARREGDSERAAVLDETVAHMRQGVRDLRSLLVEIHPPTVSATGLDVAIADLLSPLQGVGIETEFELDDATAAGTRHDELLYRAAREAVRNSARHAAATHVRVTARRTSSGSTRLVMEDDGQGFDTALRAGRQADGHLGLRLVQDLVAEAGGTMDVRSTPGKGTTVELELPA